MRDLALFVRLGVFGLSLVLVTGCGATPPPTTPTVPPSASPAATPALRPDRVPVPGTAKPYQLDLTVAELLALSDQTYDVLDGPVPSRPGVPTRMRGLGTLGGSEVTATAINNSGEVVGWSTLGRVYLGAGGSLATGPLYDDRHAFVWRDGVMADLGTLGGDESLAKDINDDGVIVGESTMSPGRGAPRRAVMWRNRNLTDLGTLGGPSASANAVNGAAQVVGTSDTASGGQHAFLWQGGAMLDLGTLGGSTSCANDINDDGQIVGEAYTSDGPHAFLWRAGAMLDLGTLGGLLSGATAINDRGDVVGWSEVAGAVNGQPLHAFLWRDGAMTDLGTLGGSESIASDVNDDGVIVGESWAGQHGGSHLVLWRDGRIVDLGTVRMDLGQSGYVPSWCNATGVNDSGQVVGGCEGGIGGWEWDRAFLLGAAPPVASVSSPTIQPGAPLACPTPPVHVVATGETLSGIAHHHGVTVQGLVAANPQITDRGVIHPGDRIVISPIAIRASDGESISAYAINDRGQVVGGIRTPSGDERAALWQDGRLIDLGTLGGRWSAAYDINNRGQVVGEAYLASGWSHPFLWQDGTMTDLAPGAEGWPNAALGINERGQVVGESFLWQDGVTSRIVSGTRGYAINDAGTLVGARDLWNAAGIALIPYDLNNRGQVVGTDAGGDRAHAYLWDAGVMTDLGSLRVDSSSRARGVNEAGQIVGDDMVGGNPPISVRAFVWQAGVMTDLGSLEGSPDGTVAEDINECGVAVGTSGAVGVLWYVPRR